MLPKKLKSVQVLETVKMLTSYLVVQAYFKKRFGLALKTVGMMANTLVVQG